MCSRGTLFAFGRAFLIVLIVLAAGAARATELPIGFVESPVADHLISPTAVAIAPDGRIFVAEQSGQIRLIKNGVLLPTPFLQLLVDDLEERGLLGIALDPDFAVNHYVYVYYPPAGVRAYRLSRFTADGDVALAGETILVQLPPYGSGYLHFGGGLRFAPDGTLYLSVGDHLRSDQAPLLTSVFGKMLRLNADGSIPTDNPFFSSTSGLNRAIWARGLRNPFNFDIHPRTGLMFINDVGQAAWDEINEGLPGADYGWPTTEGPTADPAFVSPTYAYSHFGIFPDWGCAVTGAAFYAPEVPVFPPQYRDGYFFGDFCGRYVRYLDAATHAPTNFAFGLPGDVTDVDVGPDGSLYYLVRSSGGDRLDDEGALYRIAYTASLAPQITAHPESQTILLGDPVTFSAAALEATGHQWQRDGVDIPGATATSYSLPAVALLDDRTEFQFVATNEFGSTTSSAAVLTVTTNRAPTATIAVDAPRELFFAGDLIQFTGTAEDPEDGPLDPSVFTWRVDFHHGTHFHPFLPPSGGVGAGEFTTALEGETSPNVWYRIHLRVEDSEGRASATSEDVYPELATFSLETDPTGLQLTLDGQPLTAPHSVTGVVNLTRRLGAPAVQTLGGITHQFAGWSDSGARQHAISVPPGQTTYTAFFTAVTTSTTGPTTTTTSSTTTTTSSTATTSTSTTSTTTSTTTTTTSTTTTTTLPPLGPLAFHKLEVSRGARPLPAFGPLVLQDRLATARYDVLRPRQLGFPAAEGGEDGFDAVTHLLEYGIRAVEGAPDFPKQTAVRLGDACDELPVELKRPVSLLVPAAQSPDAPVAPPDPAAHGIDHFLCYRARAPRSLARLGIQVDVMDSLHAGRYELERITKLCEPVATSGAPLVLTGEHRGELKSIEPMSIREPSRRLVCYEARRARRTLEQGQCGAIHPGQGARIESVREASVRRRGLHVSDSFGAAQVDAKARGEICLPLPPTGVSP